MLSEKTNFPKMFRPNLRQAQWIHRKAQCHTKRWSLQLSDLISPSLSGMSNATWGFRAFCRLVIRTKTATVRLPYEVPDGKLLRISTVRIGKLPYQFVSFVSAMQYLN